MSGFIEHESNFAFLADTEPNIARLGAEAEMLISVSPNTCIMEVRLIAELLAKSAATYFGMYEAKDRRFFDALEFLEGESSFGRNVRDVFHNVRREANDVVHGEFINDKQGVARHYVKQAYRLAVWFQRTIHDPSFVAPPFQRPPDYGAQRNEILRNNDELRRRIDKTQNTIEEVNTEIQQEKRRRANAEELAARLEEERDAFKELVEESFDEIGRLRETLDKLSAAEQQEQRERQLDQMQKASDLVELDEAATRAVIDAQLRNRGWMADSESMRWANGERPDPKKAKAIAEVPTANGPADYVLFIGLEPVAVIEAKRYEKDIASDLDQARRYSAGFELLDGMESPGGPWRVDDKRYTLPFVFASNGREFHEQIRQKSGVWFHDLRREEELGRPLAGWYTPEGLEKLLETDADAAFDFLRDEPFDYLGLRDYQREAIEEIEQHLSRGNRRALLAMATGTGKTRTAIGLVFRMIKSGMFNRVLFVVDRRTLGIQAMESFQTVPLEDQRPFTDPYEALSIDDSTLESETRLSISTIQGMVARVVDADSPEDRPPVDQFDCIIVDECHRGYNLDREMNDVEMEHREQERYISKYKRVLDYFDAVRIGLTATPAQHTSAIFGRPVYQYRYQEAVIDGYLADQDPVIQIETELSKHGIHYKPGETITLIDGTTGEIDYAEAPDEMDYDVSSFNRSILTPGFTEAVCGELVKRIDLKAEGKTLVFCVDEDHANSVAAGLLRAYKEAGADVTEDTIKKITGYNDNAERDLRFFKNEINPKIAVTVDYLTTGVDVPKIVNLIFLRRVKSRILYEQMKGRATRLCDEIGKDAFRIYDCVYAYDAVEGVTDMHPVVTTPRVTMKDNFDWLTSEDSPEHMAQNQRELVGKLQRKSQRLGEKGHRQFEKRAGMTMQEFAENIRDRQPEEAAAWLQGKGDIIDEIPRLAGKPNMVPYDDRPDEVIGTVERNEILPGYLDSFEEYVQAALNRIEVMQMVAQRPRSLTRAALIELRQVLEREGYDTERLEKAWSQQNNEYIAASVMGFVRQAALGEPLVPYADRVNYAVERVKNDHELKPEQIEWLDLIRTLLINDETVPDPAILDHHDGYKAQGGYKRINKKYFDGKLRELLGEVNEGIWDYQAGA